MKSKRLLILLLMALIVPWAANAQDVEDYTFSTGESATQWITLTDAATSIVTSGDDTYSSLTDIGFSFPFGTGIYTKFWANANGIFSFSSSPSNHYTAAFTTGSSNGGGYSYDQPKICGITKDMCVPSTGGYVKYELTGTAPNRVLVCEFNLGASSSASAATIKWQVQLYESDSKVVMVYGAEPSSAFYGYQIGLSQSSSDIWTVNASTHEATHATGAVATTNGTYSSGVWPGANRYYQFSRPVVTCQKPDFTVNNVTTEGTTANLTWTAGGTETSWAVAHALVSTADPDDNILNGNVTTLPTATSPFEVPNLALGEHYFWVRANCEGNDHSEWKGPVQVHIGYCTPNPSSRDNKGITAVSFGTGNYIMDTSNANGLPASSPYYADYTFKVGGVPAGMTALVNISYTTGYNYGTLIWVDWNNNLAFEDSEIVFAGQSSDIAQPSGTHELEASFSIPSTQAQGDYRMRIAGADGYFDTYISNPSGTGAHSACFSSSYAVCHDYTLRVLEQPSCMPVSALTVDEANVTATQIPISWTAGGTEDSWNIRWRKYGTTDTYSTATVTTNSYTISGLTADTKYEFGVQAGCDTQNIWIEDSYTTACGVVTIPADGWPQNFDSYTGVTSGSINNLPHCWYYINTTSYSSYQGYPIIYGSSYSSGHSGKNYLYFYSYYSSSYSYYDPQPQYAILPEMGNLDGKQITLWAKGYNASSTFKIGRMTNPADATTFVPIEISNGVYEQALTTSYQEFTYELTGNGNFLAIMIDAASSSRTYNGVSIDDILIEPVPSCKRPSALMLETPSSRTAHSATLKWTKGSEDQTAWQIAYSTASNFNPDTVMTIVDADSNPFILTGLDQSTTYYAYVRANCGTAEEPDYSKWSSAKATFATVSGHQTPTNLAVDQSTITSTQATVNWKGVAANELHTYYELYYSRLSSRPNPLEPDSLIVVSGQIDTTYTFNGLTPETKYYVWVRDTCGTDGYSNWTSSINFTTASACQTPDGLAANDVTINSASITWNTYGLSEFNLRYRALGEEWTDLSGVSIPCPLSNLTQNTPYQVLVQPTCNTEVWSDTLNFRTDCAPKTITETNFINEGFEDYVGTTYNTAGVVPYCWDNYSTSATYPYPHIVGSGSYYYVHGGTKSLNFESDYGHATYVALPEFTNDLNTLQVSFWMRMENASQGYLTLGYITAEDVNYNTYTVIDSCQRSGSMVQNMLYLALKNVPSTATRLVFKWIYEGNSYYACCIDDVVVKLAPSCIPVKTFATSNVKAHSVDLTWTVYDETQTSFDVQYGFSQNFHEDSTFINNGVSLTEGKYVLSGLTHDTTYYVRVRANCGGGEVSPWSDSKRVVTPAGNQAPSTFAIVSGSEGPHYVSLVWNQGGELAESWDLYYVKSETAPEEAPTVATPATVTVNTLPTAEAPYLLEGLDAESRYYIWVRANCGIDGLSAWKALTGSCFTTLEACPMPVNGEVTNMTPVSAQLNWTGYAENYNVQYRTAAYSYPAEGSFFEDFESGTLNGWTVIRGGEGNTSTDWMAFDGNFGNGIVPAHSGTYVARSRSYAGNGYHVDNWLISPQLTLNGQLNYWARGNASYPEHYEVYVSTTTSDTTAFTLLYTPSTVTGEWVEHTVDLSTFAGQQGYIAFRNTDYDKDYLFIDDVLVGTKVTVEAGAWSASIPAVGDSLVIERLSPETAYEWKVQAVCGGEDGSSLWSDSTSFTTPSACDAPVNLAATNETYNSATLSWSNYQETYNLRYRTAADADIYLEDSFEDGELGDWTVNLTSTSTYENGVQEGYFAFAYTYNPPQYLISPLLDENGVVEGSTLFFQYEGSDDDSPETFQVGYSSTTNDVSAFTWGNTITIGEDEDVYSQTIPAGTKYFAIKHTAYDAYWLYLWNFYAFGPVTPAGEWVDVEGPVENPYTLTGLNPDTPYEFQVQGNNTSCEGDTTAWSQIGWFETLPLPTQTIALVEGANWVSFNVETNLNDLKAALVEAFPNTAISIKSKNQTHSYNPSNNRWSGRFDALNLANMYIIRVVQNGEIVLQGLPVDPSEHPITINAGVSVYLAYPFSENMTLTDAFAGFASNGDKIKSKTKNCNYTRNRWGNQITSLEPGKGYIYVGAADAGDGRVFVYPDNSNRGAQETVQTPKMHIFPDASKATLKAMPIPTIDKKASKSSTKALDKKGMPNEQKD